MCVWHTVLHMDNTPDITGEVGEALRIMRIAQGLTLRQLAEMSSTNHAYLSQVERGLKTPTDRWKRAVMEALAKNLAGAA